MALKLTKGERLSLTKNNPGLRRVRLQIGWEKTTGKGVDIDISSFGIGTDDKAQEAHLVFFHQKESADGAVSHSGDNRVGLSDTSQAAESVVMDLSKVSADIVKHRAFVTIDRALERGQTFGVLKQAWFKILNDETGEVLREYDLDAQFTTAISMEIGAVAREGDNWVFHEIGQGYPSADFVAIAQQLGIQGE